MKCKISNTEIKPFMSFGKMPISNAFLSKDKFFNEFFFDMEVGFSEKLSLFQLNDHPTPKKMFHDNYPFFTGSSEYMKIHFKNFADWVKKKYLNNSSKIVELGSNDKLACVSKICFLLCLRITIVVLVKLKILLCWYNYYKIQNKIIIYCPQAKIIAI